LFEVFFTDPERSQECANQATQIRVDP